MPPAATKPALKREPTAKPTIQSAPAAVSSVQVVARPAKTTATIDQIKPPLRSVAATPPAQRQNGFHFQARVPVIAGEATYRGLMPIDGLISGQLNASGGALSIKQRTRSGPLDRLPELNGEICFKDMLRVNGYIAGKVLSEKGTLIIAAGAQVDAYIEVGVAVIGGRVNGDVVGHERVELGPGAIIHGNISTRSLTMKPGAIFQGDCRIVKNENGDK